METQPPLQEPVGYQRAVHHLGNLLENAKSETVKLAAIKDVLDRSDFQAVERQEIYQISEFAG